MSNLGADLDRHERQRTRRWIAENTVTNPRWPSLAAWSIQEIQALYLIYGRQLEEYKDIADRFEINLPVEAEPGEVIPVPVGAESFVNSWYNTVHKINSQIRVLDAEISRRNTLVGVM